MGFVAVCLGHCTAPGQKNTLATEVLSLIYGVFRLMVNTSN